MVCFLGTKKAACMGWTLLHCVFSSFRARVHWEETVLSLKENCLLKACFVLYVEKTPPHTHTQTCFVLCVEGPVPQVKGFCFKLPLWVYLSNLEVEFWLWKTLSNVPADAVLHENYVLTTLPEAFLQCGTRSMYQHCRRPFWGVAREVCTIIAGGLFAVWH